MLDIANATEMLELMLPWKFALLKSLKEREWALFIPAPSKISPHIKERNKYIFVERSNTTVKM